MALIYYRLNKLDTAFYHQNRAIKYLKEGKVNIKDSKLLANCFINLGDLYVAVHDNKLARRSFQYALEHYEMKNNYYHLYCNRKIQELDSNKYLNLTSNYCLKLFKFLYPQMTSENEAKCLPTLKLANRL